jgi:hypothetical protein
MSKDEPPKWVMPLTVGPGVLGGTWNGECWTYNAPTEPADTLTLRKLYDAARNLPKPHPLAGLTIVYYADNMRDAALQFVEEYNKPPRLGAPIVAARSDYLQPGHIIGKRGDDIVLIAGPEKKPEGDQSETEG